MQERVKPKKKVTLAIDATLAAAAAAKGIDLALVLEQALQAPVLGVIPQKIHYWIKHGWIHSRRTPSGKHVLVWADKDEIRRLRRLAKVKQSWLRARHPELIIPKRRPAR